MKPRIREIFTPIPENVKNFENKRKEISILIRRKKRLAAKERLEYIDN